MEAIDLTAVRRDRSRNLRLRSRRMLPVKARPPVGSGIDNLWDHPWPSEIRIGTGRSDAFRGSFVHT